MIWAAGISKIINYILKDIPDYNNVSTIMAQSKNDPYKQLKNYKTAISGEDDLRDGRDYQLLFYLLHKKLISKTQYNKLKGCYTTRCDCAHPTDIKLSPNEAIIIFDNIYQLIFSNKTL